MQEEEKTENGTSDSLLVLVCGNSRVSGVETFSLALLFFPGKSFDWTIYIFIYIHFTLTIENVSNFRFSMISTAFLTIIMTINWIFEIISFYNETSATLFDIFNALQGVLIFLMFVCLPRPMNLIKSWWKDRGSFQVLSDDSFVKSPNDIQMTSLCKQRGERERVFSGKMERFE